MIRATITLEYEVNDQWYEEPISDELDAARLDQRAWDDSELDVNELLYYCAKKRDIVFEVVDDETGEATQL